MRATWTAVLAAACLLGPLAASSIEPAPSRLAAELRSLYRELGPRYERRAASALLADGSRAPRDLAYRDRRDFVGAASWLLASRASDDAPLGAWLLGTVPGAGVAEAEPILIEALSHPDPRAAFEAARALGERGTAECIGALEAASRRADSVPVQAAASWAAARVAERAHRSPPSRPAGTLLPASFRRGLSWWGGERGRDDGAASFAEIAALGVGWVEVHTWEPRQKALDVPDFAPADGRFALGDLLALVRRAHGAGLRVLYKPHLEVRGFHPTPEEEAVFRSGDRAARRRLFAQIRREGRWLAGRHNEIEMRTEDDWRAWFSNYGGYILGHAREAEAAQVDMFSVGRELDRTVLRREADWRALIDEVRAVYHGPLTYSANFDTYRELAFWDALDFIGISAYFALSDLPDPAPADLAHGWDEVLAPLEAVHRRFGRPVLFTEMGYPAVAGAAAAPWREAPGAADVWLQSRLYEAAFAAIARRPWIEGAFPWLWEANPSPPFRDPSFSIQGKPAAFVMARWYGGGGGGGKP